jgi:thiamine-phosphate pyrophosphorylase
MRAISKLHFITTNAATAEMACLGGVDWVQLRLKNVSYDEYRSVALTVQAVCKAHNATFIINDNPALALEIKADGVHLGKEDMSPDEARKMLGDNFIIGCTANTADDIAHLSKYHINYIGLGPYRFTATKEKLSPVLGLAGYEGIYAELLERNITPPPIVGIGGIIEEDILALLGAGLHGIAVSGSIANATDIAAAATRFKDAINFVTI